MSNGLQRLLSAISILRAQADRIEAPQIQILLEIAKRPAVTSQELQAVVGISQASVSRNCAALGEGLPRHEGLMLVESVDDPGNRKRKIHFLTPAGRALVAQLLTAIEGEPVEFSALTFREWKLRGLRS